jgi:asparagine synthase (glutamine-hydrolysing)
LRRELVAHGLTFRTESDTEVLANALQAWGVQALQRLIGMYAFVAIDVETGVFVAARDPFGVKPLYVIQNGDAFLFCSEMRPLLDAVADHDVMLLPPGYLLARNICTRYKSAVPAPAATRTPHDVKILDRVLAEAVRTRLPPGLPVGVQFSGGIDSTLVAHYARQFRPDVPGYFVGGMDAPDYRYAADYAERTGFDLRLVPFAPDSADVFARIDEVVAATESFEPNLIRVAVCSMALAEAMHKDGLRVALCGEAADELFCGYPPLEIAYRDDEVSAAAFRDECLGLMHRVSLQRVDRCSMRHQVETREPFLDPAVVHYALNVEASALVREVDGLPRGKAALRDLYDLYPNELPVSIRDRVKLPFAEGAGLDVSPQDSAWKTCFNDAISDNDLREGQKEFELFNIQSKEELYYIRKLAETIDVFRVPHLRDRAWISFPVAQNIEKLKAYAHFSL